MKRLLSFLMVANAALFVCGAVQHAGVAIGPFREPTIVPATIVEGLCALALLWGAWRVLRNQANGWRRPLIANLIAAGGVLLGIAALAAGRGPRTASNAMMLILIAASVIVLFTRRTSLSGR